MPAMQSTPEQRTEEWILSPEGIRSISPKHYEIRATRDEDFPGKQHIPDSIAEYIVPKIIEIKHGHSLDCIIADVYAELKKSAKSKEVSAEDKQQGLFKLLLANRKKLAWAIGTGVIGIPFFFMSALAGSWMMQQLVSRAPDYGMLFLHFFDTSLFVPIALFSLRKCWYSSIDYFQNKNTIIDDIEDAVLFALDEEE